MMLKAIFRPLKKWPGLRTDPTDRRRSPFDSSYVSTLDLLERELAHLRAHNVVIQVIVDPSQIRNDGLLRTITAIKDPAVIVSFSSSGGDEYSYPCDTFTDYPSNLRAIALALEALRKVDRYGVTRRGEQYQGFRALPPPDEPAPVMSVEQAAEFIGSLTGVPASTMLADRDLFDMTFKLASKRVHPDTANGSHDQFVKLQEAGAVLKERHFK